MPCALFLHDKTRDTVFTYDDGIAMYPTILQTELYLILPSAQVCQPGRLSSNDMVVIPLILQI